MVPLPPLGKAIERGATYALLVGFCLMLVSDYFLG